MNLETLVHFLFLLLRDRTVKGQLEGPPAQLAKMKDWLSKTGNQLIILHNLFKVSHFFPYYVAAPFYYFFRLPVRNCYRALFLPYLSSFRFTCSKDPQLIFLKHIFLVLKKCRNYPVKIRLFA